MVDFQAKRQPQVFSKPCRGFLKSVRAFHASLRIPEGKENLQEEAENQGLTFARELRGSLQKRQEIWLPRLNYVRREKD